MLLVNVVLWLQVFVVPSAVFGFAAFLLYKKSSENVVYSILLLAAGNFRILVSRENTQEAWSFAFLFQVNSDSRTVRKK